jgi:hypothetical protein
VHHVHIGGATHETNPDEQRAKDEQRVHEKVLGIDKQEQEVYELKHRQNPDPFSFDFEKLQR